jgi:hypothetical protein
MKTKHEEEVKNQLIINTSRERTRLEQTILALTHSNLLARISSRELLGERD